MRNKQKGMGITEVLVAMVMLTIGISAMVSVQLAATKSTEASLKKVEAINIAKDYIEIMRTNPTQKATYDQLSINDDKMKNAAGSLNCYTAECTLVEKAKFDLTQVYKRANERGYSIRANTCNLNSARRCVFVSWGETQPTEGTSSANGGVGSNDRAADYNCAVVSNGQLVIPETANCAMLEGM